MNNKNWILKIAIIAFLITIIFSLGSQFILNGVGIVIGIVVIIVFIIIGILFDIIGVAVQSSSDTPFHAMASKKISKAKKAKKMIKNAPQVSSFCNDVIGDICNIITGSAGVVVASRIAHIYNSVSKNKSSLENLFK